MSSAWAWIEFYKQEALKAGCNHGEIDGSQRSDAAKMLASAHIARSAKPAPTRPTSPSYVSLLVRIVFILLVAAALIFAANNFLLPFFDRNVM